MPIPTLAAIKATIDAELPLGWESKCGLTGEIDMPTDLVVPYLYAMIADRAEGVVTVADSRWLWVWVYPIAEPQAGAMAFVWSDHIRAADTPVAQEQLLSDVYEACRRQLEAYGLIEGSP
jgi:hypothetical protein